MLEIREIARPDRLRSGTEPPTRIEYLDRILSQRYIGESYGSDSRLPTELQSAIRLQFASATGSAYAALSQSVSVRIRRLEPPVRGDRPLA